VSLTNETLPKTEKCPYCEAERKIPPYAYAYWDENFFVTCGMCGKAYSFSPTEAEIAELRAKGLHLSTSGGGWWYLTGGDSYGRHYSEAIAEQERRERSK
jgi:hypothetical protein